MLYVLQKEIRGDRISLLDSHKSVDNGGMKMGKQWGFFVRTYRYTGEREKRSGRQSQKGSKGFL